MCAFRYSVSLIANALNATFDRKATSGVHSVKTTVCSSVALISLMFDGLLSAPHSAGPSSG